MAMLDDPADGIYSRTRPDLGGAEPVSATYLGEPYVRARVPRVDGRPDDLVDAKAARWTSTHVLLHWETAAGGWNVWVEADRVTRIRRRDSSWQFVYDNPELYPDGDY